MLDCSTENAYVNSVWQQAFERKLQQLKRVWKTMHALESIFILSGVVEYKTTSALNHPKKLFKSKWHSILHYLQYLKISLSKLNHLFIYSNQFLNNFFLLFKYIYWVQNFVKSLNLFKRQVLYISSPNLFVL